VIDSDHTLSNAIDNTTMFEHRPLHLHVCKHGVWLLRNLALLALSSIVTDVVDCRRQHSNIDIDVQYVSFTRMSCHPQSIAVDGISENAVLKSSNDRFLKDHSLC